MENDWAGYRLKPLTRSQKGGRVKFLQDVEVREKTVFIRVDFEGSPGPKP